MDSWDGQILPSILEDSFLIKDHIHHIEALEVPVTVILPPSMWWGVPQPGGSVLALVLSPPGDPEPGCPGLAELGY